MTGRSQREGQNCLAFESAGHLKINLIEFRIEPFLLTQPGSKELEDSIPALPVVSFETSTLHDIKHKQKNSNHLPAEASWPLAVDIKVLGGL